MVIIYLLVLGLVFGSFVNALVWRVHSQERASKKTNNHTGTKVNLSIISGRSICPNCKHQLASKDLVPVLSWLTLKGKCRYCGKQISPQYPLVEILTAVLFIGSYVWWPNPSVGLEVAIFAIWLAILVGLIALTVYDLKWLILPTRLIRPLLGLALLQATLIIVNSNTPIATLIGIIIASLIGGGLFYMLYQVSNGKWIGGGDVRLGWLLGIIAGTPAKSLLLIFIASLLGSLISLPLLYAKKLRRSSTIPFGPFLIAGTIVVELFGSKIIDWYQTIFLNI